MKTNKCDYDDALHGRLKGISKGIPNKFSREGKLLLHQKHK